MHLAIPEKNIRTRNLNPTPQLDDDARFTLLLHVYLEAGLPPHAAMLAARADLPHPSDDRRWEESP